MIDAARQVRGRRTVTLLLKADDRDAMMMMTIALDPDAPVPEKSARL